ncbi:MAG: ATP-binding protein [Verrucomicrobiota bacterium]
MPTLHHNHPEKDERTALTASTHAPKYAAKFAAFPDDWRKLITEAFDRQRDLGASDRSFAGTVMSATSWNQLVNGAYPVPSTAKGISGMTAKLELVVQRGDKLASDRASKKAAGETRSIAERFVSRIELLDLEDALEAATERLKKDNEERVVVITGATRSGKTWLIKKLMSEQRVNWHFKASGGLKSRYRAFLEELASLMRLRDVEGKTVDKLEKSIIAKLSNVEGVLAVEELQRFSPRALEFFKDLLNHSKVTLVLCMLPGQWQKMTRSNHEDMQQFLGRCVSRIDLHVTAEVVQDFAPSLWARCAKKEAEALCATIAREAEAGGSMSLVRDVCEGAAIFAGRHGPVTREHIEKALSAYRGGVPVLGTAARKSFGLKKAA